MNQANSFLQIWMCHRLTWNNDWLQQGPLDGTGSSDPVRGGWRRLSCPPAGDCAVHPANNQQTQSLQTQPAHLVGSPALSSPACSDHLLKLHSWQMEGTQSYSLKCQPWFGVPKSYIQLLGIKFNTMWCLDIGETLEPKAELFFPNTQASCFHNGLQRGSAEASQNWLCKFSSHLIYGCFSVLSVNWKLYFFRGNILFYKLRLYVRHQSFIKMKEINVLIIPSDKK